MFLNTPLSRHVSTTEVSWSSSPGLSLVAYVLFYDFTTYVKVLALWKCQIIIAVFYHLPGDHRRSTCHDDFRLTSPFLLWPSKPLPLTEWWWKSQSRSDNCGAGCRWCVGEDIRLHLKPSHHQLASPISPLTFNWPIAFTWDLKQNLSSWDLISTLELWVVQHWLSSRPCGRVLGHVPQCHNSLFRWRMSPLDINISCLGWTTGAVFLRRLELHYWTLTLWLRSFFATLQLPRRFFIFYLAQSSFHSYCLAQTFLW